MKSQQLNALKLEVDKEKCGYILKKTKKGGDIMTGITSAGLGAFTLRGVIGFREDYLYFKKEKFSLRSYYKYLKNKTKKR